VAAPPRTLAASAAQFLGAPFARSYKEGQTDVQAVAGDAAAAARPVAGAQRLLNWDGRAWGACKGVLLPAGESVLVSLR